MSTVAIIPMAGTGTRLGMPFHKSLAPTLTTEGIKPLYWHVWSRLQAARPDRTVFVLSEAGFADPCLDNLPGERFQKPWGSELASSLASVARTLRPDDVCLVGLPDSIWYPDNGFRVAQATYWGRQPADGVMLLFRGDNRVLDQVTLDPTGRVTSTILHAPAGATERRVLGWGGLVASAGCLATLADVSDGLGPQLAEFAFYGCELDGEYMDLGTPERYVRNMDQT